MSRCYNMTVVIERYDRDRLESIKEAAQSEWPLDREMWYADEDWTMVQNDADGSLCGGESEEQFTERLSLAIWKANAAFCQVTVDATYVDDLPFQTHCLDEDEYQRLMEREAAIEN